MFGFGVFNVVGVREVALLVIFGKFSVFPKKKVDTAPNVSEIIRTWCLDCQSHFEQYCIPGFTGVQQIMDTCDLSCDYQTCKFITSMLKMVKLVNDGHFGRNLGFGYL